MSEPVKRDENLENAERDKRREFLRKSAYAASAAPVMLALFHAKSANASAACPSNKHWTSMHQCVK
jgi:hypothetical protein